MDLLSIVGKIWRHKFATIPVLILTALGAFYVISVKAPVYQATAGVLLVNPPGPPTPAQIAKDPRLGKIDTNNTFVSFGNLDVVADAVIGVVTAKSNQLVQAGVDPRYQLATSTEVGLPPIINITGMGSSAQKAILSANLVAKEAENSLYQMQVKQKINPTYMIKAFELYAPQNAQASASGKLRTLIAVLAVGAIVLFIVISMIESVAKRRSDKSPTESFITRGANHSAATIARPKTPVRAWTREQ
jgi:Chain length determinant protein